MNMIEEIGNVQLILDDYSGFDHYSDGDIENDLLNIVCFEKDYDAAIERDGRWPVFYHLSKRRETIVQPMDIKKNDAVLEIGAGCGAVTKALAAKAGSPAPDLASQVASLTKTLHFYETVDFWLLAAAMLLMTTARYWSF